MSNNLGNFPRPPRRLPEDNFEKNVGRVLKVGIGFWIVSALLSVAFVIAVIWGIVQVVQALT